MVPTRIPFVPDWQFTTVNADMKWAQQNRDLVIRFLPALQRWRNFMTSNPEEIAAVATDELRAAPALARRAPGDTA